MAGEGKGSEEIKLNLYHLASDMGRLARQGKAEEMWGAGPATGVSFLGGRWGK